MKADLAGIEPATFKTASSALTITPPAPGHTCGTYAKYGRPMKLRVKQISHPTYADNEALPAFASRCCNSRSLSPPGPQQRTCSSGLAVVGPCCGRQTDGRTPYRFVDPVPHIIRAESINDGYAGGSGQQTGLSSHHTAVIGVSNLAGNRRVVPPALLVNTPQSSCQCDVHFIIHSLHSRPLPLIAHSSRLQLDDGFLDSQ